MWEMVENTITQLCASINYSFSVDKAYKILIIKKLTRHAYSYRLRVGDYRVFFEFDGGVHIIEIEEVKKRDESTY
jgi:mRNA-degrading endonuclease RelE of RelBE toxin-antitoxin system